ncbi:MAG TPA: sulfur carrier protein ThiS [Candidatus Dormibacteraeota bacterium]|nr:sulfur carrier protein ThiS [Candidatus Dormibacteraeota bacterium]
MIHLRVNGKTVELPGPTPLLDYVRSLGVDPRAIAVEINGEILSRDRYGDRVLQEGDVVEIVRMVGGGLGPEPSPVPGIGRRPGRGGQEANLASCRHSSGAPPS